MINAYAALLAAIAAVPTQHHHHVDWLEWLKADAIKNPRSDIGRALIQRNADPVANALITAHRGPLDLNHPDDLDTAINLIGIGDPNAAANLLMYTATGTGRYGNARTILADALIRSGRGAEAWDVLVSIVDKWNTSADRDRLSYLCGMRGLVYPGQLEQAHMKLFRDGSRSAWWGDRPTGDPAQRLSVLALLNLAAYGYLDEGAGKRFEDMGFYAERALELAPNCPIALYLAADYRNDQSGRSDEAMQLLERALQLVQSEHLKDTIFQEWRTADHRVRWDIKHGIPPQDLPDVPVPTGQPRGADDLGAPQARGVEVSRPVLPGLDQQHMDGQ